LGSVTLLPTLTRRIEAPVNWVLELDAFSLRIFTVIMMVLQGKVTNPSCTGFFLKTVIYGLFVI